MAQNNKRKYSTTSLGETYRNILGIDTNIIKKKKKEKTRKEVKNILEISCLIFFLFVCLFVCCVFS